MWDNPHCGQRRLFIEMAPRNEIVSASLLQRVSPLYSTFQPYICSTTLELSHVGGGNDVYTIKVLPLRRVHGLLATFTQNIGLLLSFRIRIRQKPNSDHEND